MFLHIVYILAPLFSHSEAQPTYRQERCLRGTDQLTAASSCREIIASQADCLGAHASGMYWLKTGGAAQQVYCDLAHSGGGWMRIVNFHHDGNESCPTFPESGLNPEWEGFPLINGSLYCLKGGWNGGTEGRSIIWNSAQNVSYSEIRGYAQLRLISENGNLGEGDGFKGPNNDIWNDDYADSLSIEIPGTNLRHIYAYIIGSETRKCPEEFGTRPPPYLVYEEKAYVCGHINSGDDRDENGVYQISPHTTGGDLGGCRNCPPGSPWFHHQIGELVNHPIRLRMTDYRTYEGVHTAISELELYVR